MRVREAHQQLLGRFGKNPYGANSFRVVWGPSRTRIFGGYWDDVAKWEYRVVPKYGPNPQWIIERWQPATTYGSPFIWDQQTLLPDGFWACGPFPVHGDFECITKFSAKDAGDLGILPEPGLVLFAVREHLLTQMFSASQRKQAHEDAAMAKERKQDRDFDDIWAEAQLSRPGLSIGAGGAFNKQQEIDDYARRIERAHAFVNAQRFRAGFRQQ